MTISKNGLTVPPHALMFGKLSLRSSEFQSNTHTAPEFKLTNLGGNGMWTMGYIRQAGRRASPKSKLNTVPRIYLLSRTQGGLLHIRDCGIPEPIWPDKSGWDFEGGTTEEHDGFSLSPNRLYVLRSVSFLVQSMIIFQRILYQLSTTSH